MQTFFPRWRELQRDRLDEAVRTLGAVPGVHGLLIGGSVARGEAWPMSDIDLLPLYADTAPHVAELVETRRAELVDWWAASGRAQSLDLGRLAFTVDEARAAVASGPAGAAARLRADARWFHGMDKAYGGRAADPESSLTDRFARWITAMRFEPLVVEARIARWYEDAGAAREQAHTARRAGRHEEAAGQLREAARALRQVAVESWGERLGSMGREWTRFERMALVRGEDALAARIARIAGAHPDDVARGTAPLPGWLQERVDLCWAARRAVGEDVTVEQNTRDQVAAFTLHVTRHRPDLGGAWLTLRAPHLDVDLDELDALYGELSGASVAAAASGGGASGGDSSSDGAPGGDTADESPAVDDPAGRGRGRGRGKPGRAVPGRG
ncbi:nucleotidyltransferase domain-containing protein [Streptomyces tsukubensis]|uniref:Polymerase nucleotidyl transferase domain-containing protein n=1 Tax=Streptomyces tsukubensis TaxID=83656 RepID=A0A1V4AF98_9ACTN|nr:nucleotidyltransferase domain-containing protein [Streptomyces tsukubensis]OON82234.1 hypothetical protein B1H18_04135 [Streptomyces tsukubensis]